MNYRITHTTNYTYASAVSVCHNVVMLTPRDGTRVKCQSHRLTVRPTPELSNRRRDFFGNNVHTFSIEENHRQLSITATSHVTVEPGNLPDAALSPAWEFISTDISVQADPAWPQVCPYMFDSPRVKRNEQLKAYAEPSFPADRPIIAAAVDLTSRIHQDFAYDTTATNVTSTTEEAFSLRKGVCQDFAHIMVGCFRSVGLPARYVSGYLRTNPPEGKPRLVGADESHAWVSVYAGREIGWLDVDPTNDCICGTDHVPIAWGRDYGDVVPIRGVFLGGGKHTMQVSVDVCPVDVSSGSASATIEST